LKRFVDEGARVVGIDRNEETGSQILDFGTDVLFCKANVSVHLAVTLGSQDLSLGVA